MNKEVHTKSMNNLQENNDKKEISVKRYLLWIFARCKMCGNGKFSEIRKKGLKYKGNILHELKKRIGLIKISKTYSIFEEYGKSQKKSSDCNTMLNNFRGLASKSGAGFTLIELMVVFGISAIIATVVIGKYPDFSSKIEFENEALDIALTLREAQVYGVGARRVSVGSPADPFNVAYGVSFDITNPKIFILFADLDNNGFYDAVKGEKIETVVIKDNFEIKDLCIQSSSLACLPFGGYKFLGITFKRPNPDANISIFASPTLKILGKNATIELKNIKTNEIKTIKVTDTGQISVL